LLISNPNCLQVMLPKRTGKSRYRISRDLLAVASAL
jgi:hypothetical protein